MKKIWKQHYIFVTVILRENVKAVYMKKYFFVFFSLLFLSISVLNLYLSVKVKTEVQTLLINGLYKPQPHSEEGFSELEKDWIDWYIPYDKGYEVFVVDQTLKSCQWH